MDGIADLWGGYGSRAAFEAQERNERNRPVHMRTPSVYATRLVKQPAVISRAREMESLRASYRHAPTPECVRIKCGVCNDLAEVERLLSAGNPVALHPIFPPYPEGSPRREAK